MSSVAQVLGAYAASLDPRVILTDLGPAMSGVLGADRIGIATLAPDGGRYRNLAVWDRSTGEVVAGTVFDAFGTAASWVERTACPLVGSRLDEMRRYPGTLTYLIRERFASNILMPIDAGATGRGVLYALSRRAGTFHQGALPAALRFRDVVEPVMRAHAAAGELAEGGPDEGDAGAPGARAFADDDRPATLDEIQRRHIADVLRMTNGIIEGRRGAASVLGLNPSTLRHRMRRLGVERHARG